MREPTTYSERSWLTDFTRLMKKKPARIWFFCNGCAYVMLKKDGEKMHTPSGGVDPDYIMPKSDSFRDFEGGDW